MAAAEASPEASAKEGKKKKGTIKKEKPLGPGGRPKNAVGVEDAAAKLADQIIGGSRILAACGSDLLDEGAETIAAALLSEEAQPVIELNLRGGQVGAQGLSTLTKALKKQRGSLRRLDLGDNELGDEGLTTLCQELKHHAELKTLALRNNAISDEAIGEVCEVLALHRALEELHLGGNALTAAGAMTLAASLHHPGLQVLTLDGNEELSDASAFALSDAMLHEPPAGPPPPKKMPQAPGNCYPARFAPGVRIGGRGNIGLRAMMNAAKPGANCFRPPETGLRVLSLAQCGLTDDGGLKLAEALAKRRSGLRELHLGYNRLSNISGVKFAEALEGHETLRVLWLEGNLIGDAAAVEFVSVLSRMPREDINVCMSGNRPKMARAGRNQKKSQRFDEVGLADLIRPAKTAKAIACRGVIVGRLLKFYHAQVQAGKIEEATSTTFDVVKNVIAPEMKEYWNSFSVFFHKPHPDTYVIHAWSGLFAELVRGVLRHATGNLNPSLNPDNIFYEQNPHVLNKCYFIDAFCVNQNLECLYEAPPDPGQDPQPPRLGLPVAQMDPICETDKFDFVMDLQQLHGCDFIVVIDSMWTPLSRAWCLTEVNRCLMKGMLLDVTFGAHLPLPRERRGWGKIEQAAVSREEDRSLLQCSLLMLNGQTQDELNELEFAEMKIQEEEFATAIKMQCWLRGIWGRRKARARREKLKAQACIKIQVLWRCYLAEKLWDMENAAVTKLAKWWRKEPPGLVKRRDRRFKERQRFLMNTLLEAAKRSEKPKFSLMLTPRTVRDISLCSIWGPKLGGIREAKRWKKIWAKRLVAQERWKKLKFAVIQKMAKTIAEKELNSLEAAEFEEEWEKYVKEQRAAAVKAAAEHVVADQSAAKEAAATEAAADGTAAEEEPAGEGHREAAGGGAEGPAGEGGNASAADAAAQDEASAPTAQG
eukprot:TRINITY_DN22818_c0_g1_i1.p1 TRINITY_DN22818_c0_g1~~TRINITY_DN22818_c0_g1_i1.p1  ORF type:complete len:934 (-),score=277.87 TRINITY_DN22818_c0_g1_i1:111-2912(-)